LQRPEAVLQRIWPELHVELRLLQHRHGLLPGPRRRQPVLRPERQALRWRSSLLLGKLRPQPYVCLAATAKVRRLAWMAEPPHLPTSSALRVPLPSFLPCSIGREQRRPAIAPCSRMNAQQPERRRWSRGSARCPDHVRNAGVSNAGRCRVILGSWL
jgi:hypothetical protein